MEFYTGYLHLPKETTFGSQSHVAVTQLLFCLYFQKSFHSSNNAPIYAMYTYINHCKESGMTIFLIIGLQYPGGETGIRTQGQHYVAYGFQDRCIQPLCHYAIIMGFLCRKIVCSF